MNSYPILTEEELADGEASWRAQELILATQGCKHLIPLIKDMVKREGAAAVIERALQTPRYQTFPKEAKDLWELGVRYLEYLCSQPVQSN